MIFHMNRVAYFKTLHHTLKITWCVISLLAHHISKQRNEPLGADKSCQNRPIIGYTSVWSTGTSFCLSLTGVPSLLHPLLFFLPTSLCTDPTLKTSQVDSNSVSFSCQSKQLSRCCINFMHELTCQILTNQSIKVGRGAWSTRDHGKKRSSPPVF